jgi:hypothetical protein
MSNSNYYEKICVAESPPYFPTAEDFDYLCRDLGWFDELTPAAWYADPWLETKLPLSEADRAETISRVWIYIRGQTSGHTWKADDAITFLQLVSSWLGARRALFLEHPGIDQRNNPRLPQPKGEKATTAETYAIKCCGSVQGRIERGEKGEIDNGDLARIYDELHRRLTASRDKVYYMISREHYSSIDLAGCLQ